MANDLDQPRLGRHGGDRRSKDDQPDKKDDDIRSKEYGTSRAYIISRLRRDGRHDLVEDISDGRISAYGAAVLMGYAKRRQTVAAHGQDSDRARRPAVVDIKSLIG